MPLTKLNVSVSNVQGLDDLPNDNSGLTPEQVKATFDKAGEDIKDFINNTHVPEVEAELLKKVAAEELEDTYKLSPGGNFEGTWHGLTPAQTEPGQAAMVEAYATKFDDKVKLDRKFVPYVASSTWYLKGNPLVLKTDEEITQQLSDMKNLGVDGAIFLAHIFNSTTDTTKLYSMETVASFIHSYNKCKELGYELRTVKVHYTVDKMNAFITANSIARFKSEYKRIITEFCIAAQGKVKHFTVFNELPEVYFASDNSYDSYVQEILTLVKSYGFETGVTFMNTPDLRNLKGNEWLADYMDNIYINHYVSMGFKADKTTKDDAIQAWETSMKLLEWAKRKFNKNVIISETGVMPFWECLSNPGRWDWSGIINTGGAGDQRVMQLYMYGMFNCDSVKDTVSEIWLWTMERALYPATNNLISEYTGGVKYYEE